MPDKTAYVETTSNTEDREELGLPPVIQELQCPGAPDGEPPVLFIKWQDRPLDQGLNGVTLEALYGLLIERLERFNAAGVGCRENSLQITHLEIARNFQLQRERRMATERPPAV